MKRRKQATVPRRDILILDDHPITRYGLVKLINEEPDLRVCAEAESAQMALLAIQKSPPALILADISLPGQSGLEFLKESRCRHPEIPVLVMSMHDESVYAERVLRAGGRGYIMKSEGGEKLLDAIRQVLNGRVYVSEKVGANILDRLTGQRRDTSEARPGALTDREFEIFQLIGQGLSSREIGQQLHLSVKTIGVHRLHIKHKLKLQTMPELIRLAVRWAATQQLY
jgi:DNA-binding NarL/FixJ family response regulator